MNYLLISLFVITCYFAPNAVAQETVEEAEKPEAVERLAVPLQRYISDEFYVPLRETPCRRCIIVHRGIKSGTPIKLLAENDGWALVLTDNGVEGWMEQQHLTSTPIARVQLAKDQARLKKLADRNGQLEQIMSELRQQSKSLRQTRQYRRQQRESGR